ncbi:MAG: saccharopine dehydrogenase NADP-binding domain-containing protein [Lewinellaceae bacterium]|nr:saccharopine dehydrogenase NADP-binding domain-containing protein [Phaeodactylibacter sp.]MCB9041465.1 saccharopine dehydrogenase NADP-binding domain-containing protein [Lewinellaceae bacterium]
MAKNFLLYGAYGYTGRLIAELAIDKGMLPILAGRSEEKMDQLCEELGGIDYRVFGLNTPSAIDDGLDGVSMVLHAAGPFIHTARPMMEACLRNGVHYLDITGEIAVFEMAAALGARAREAGIMLMPGTGFDVVPTDCTALYLKEQLPDATHLQLAFSSGGSRTSQGTATTMAENLGEGGAVRENGKIKRVPLGHKTMEVPFAEGKSRFCMTIPWGDVSTAYYSTGIPNIEVYTSVHPKTYRYIKLQPYYNWLLRTSFVRNLVKSRIQKGPAGPSEEQRKRGKSYIWGKVWNEKGDTRETQLITPEGYELTAHTSLLIVQKVLEGKIQVGFQTPAKAYGSGLILEIPGTLREEEDG